MKTIGLYNQAGEVVNVIVVPESGYTAPEGFTIINDPLAAIGDTVENGVLIKPPPPSPDLTGYLEIYRDQRIYEGVSIGGVSVGTDDTTQLRLAGARLAVISDPNYTVQWKTQAGFITLDAATIIAVSDAVRAHIQKCFNAEALLVDDVFGTFEELETSFDNAYNQA